MIHTLYHAFEFRFDTALCVVFRVFALLSNILAMYNKSPIRPGKHVGGFFLTPKSKDIHLQRVFPPQLQFLPTCMKSLFSSLLRLTGVCAAFCLSQPICFAQAPPVRIMALGDSITEGIADGSGYRRDLYPLLTTDGFVVDFVGTVNYPDAGTEGWVDGDYEGHSGFKMEEIRSGLPLWLKKTDDPDVILLHVGTNDYFAVPPSSLSVNQNRLRNLISDLRSMRPHAKIIVSSLILRTDSPPDRELNQDAFNQTIPGIVAEFGSNVSFVDMHAELIGSDLADGVHPNATGYVKMADAWRTAINQVITPLGTSNVPAIVDVDAREDLNIG